MQDIKVYPIEFDQVWENKKANIEIISRELLKVDADLVLLPEMFQTGFSMNTDLAEEWNNSDSVEQLKTWASANQSAFYTSLMIKDGGKVYNRGVFVHPSGKVDFYDKRKSFKLAGEDKYFSNGDVEVIVDYLGWKIQLQICYDLRFPEIVRNRIVNASPAYDLILYVANWPDKRIHHWSSLLSARAIENQCYVASCNRIGIDANGLVYSSSSVVLGFQGEDLETKQLNQQEKHFKLEWSHLKDYRKALPFL